MTFKVPDSTRSVDQDMFEFDIAGKSYKIKRAKYLTIGEVEALEDPDSSTVVIDMFGRKGTKQGDAVRALDDEQFQALVNAWKQDSGVGVGESEAS
jgi:hypothetical protein